MTDTATKIAAVQTYVDGFAAGNADIISTMFADDATLEDPVGTDMIVGRQAIHEFYVGAVATGAKLTMLGEPRCAADFVAFPFSVAFSFEGQASVIEVIDTFKFNDDGKIIEMKAYWGPENMKSA
ncbi:MAG: nuclear transport factor 2 family protein [Pontixanthobacter sp.]